MFHGQPVPVRYRSPRPAHPVPVTGGASGAANFPEKLNHGQRITEVLVSHRHFITCSDDETIRYYGLCHGDSFDKALERKVECGSRVKCLSATPGDPGVILAGLADGRVLVFEFGKIM